METEALGIGGKAVTSLAETGGAIGLICGLLLIGMFFFLRNLLQSLQARDQELLALNQELHKALVNNASAMTMLSQVMQSRRCLANDVMSRQRIGDAVRLQLGD